MIGGMFGSLVSFDQIDRDQLNECLVAWGHKMGPWTRPPFREWHHGLRHAGDLVAVCAAGGLIKVPVAGMDRSGAFELGRVCAARPGINRVALRLWREFVFPALCEAHGFRWVISYQDAAQHNGDLYRFDGWVKLGRSSSGTDARSGAVGRDKIVWGWCVDAAERKARR